MPKKTKTTDLMPHDPDWACSEAAGRIDAVLVMLDEVENDNDPEGWTLRSAVELLREIRRTLQASIAQGKAGRKTVQS